MKGKLKTMSITLIEFLHEKQYVKCILVKNWYPSCKYSLKFKVFSKVDELQLAFVKKGPQNLNYKNQVSQNNYIEAKIKKRRRKSYL